MTDHTLGEVVRRLDEVTRRLDSLAERLDARDRTMAEQYMPRREAELRLDEVEKDNETQASFRRQVTAGAIVGLILLVANIVLAMTRVPGVGQ